MSISLDREYTELTNQCKPRRYNSPSRVEQAGATARAILDAAERLFAARGYTSVTMKEIAREAGIAPATAYLHFAGKVPVVEALADAITGDPGLSVEHVEGEAPAMNRIRLAAATLRRLNERSWLVADILRTQSGPNGELRALADEWRRRHLDAVARGVRAVAQAGQLQRGRSVQETADIIYAIGGVDVYRALVRERNWTPSEYEEWLTGFLAANLESPHDS